MRRHRWLKLTAGLVTLFAVVQPALAQGPIPYPGPGMGPSPAMSGAPGFGSSSTANYQFDPNAMFQAGRGGSPYPPSFQAWPSVSPYMSPGSGSPYASTGGTQLSNTTGLWEYSQLQKPGQSANYRFRTSYLRSKTEIYRDRFGSPGAPEYKQQILPQLLGAQQGGGAGGGGGGGQQQQQGLATLIQDPNIDFNLFNPVSGDQIEKPQPKGVMLSLDRLNSSGTGWQLWGMYTIDNDTQFNARDYVHPSRGRQPGLVDRAIQDPTFLASTDPVGPFDDINQALEANLLNLRGIPLDDDTFDDLGSGIITGGANAIYDLDFRIQTHVEHWGTGIRFMGLPVSTKNIRFTPTAGVRYMSIREDFNFFGRDSGFLYGSAQGGGAGGGGGGGGGGGMNTTLPDVKLHPIPDGIDNDFDGVVDNAGSDQEGGQQGGGGGGGGAGGAQGASFTFLNDPTIYPVTSYLNNSVNSDLAGPEVGLTYELAGRGNFRLGGFTQFGLMANHHKIRLNGDNIFVTTRESNLKPADENGSRQNRFSDSASHTSVSPVFEQQFSIEGPVFQYIPLLRRSPIFSKADFRIAYTYTWVGELTRAGDSIVWQGNPSRDLFPLIQTNRSTWRAETWDFGVSWAF